MKFKNPNIVSLLRLLVLLLFVSYYGNTTMFYHSHMVEGRLIAHSHWFWGFTNDKPVQSHSHTEQSYVLIHFLNNICIDDFTFQTQITLPLPSLEWITADYLPAAPCAESCKGIHLRAPPAAC